MTELMRRRMAMMGVKPSGGDDVVLPPEYQRVEYITSSGTQCINTGINYYKNMVYVDTQIYSKGGILIGVGASGQMANKAFSIGKNPTYGLVVDANNSRSGRGVWEASEHGLKDKTYDRFQLTSNKDGGVIFNGTFYATTAGLDTNQRNTIPLYLFARNYGGSINTPISASIYRCTIWNLENGVEIQRDFIPCYRKTDNKPGMFDLVSEQFFTNSGTGEFEIGGNVK